MELKVEGNRFYVLEVGGEKWVHNNMDSAIQALKERLQVDNDLNSENIRIIEVSILKRKWKIQEVPWIKIILDLIRDEKAQKG
jgi:hypothetical protein